MICSRPPVAKRQVSLPRCRRPSPAGGAQVRCLQSDVGLCRSDLKNIVTQLSLMIRNAERHRDNPEFQSDMLMTVEHAVERMRQLMLQLREGPLLRGPRLAWSSSRCCKRLFGAKRSQGRSSN